jgi:aspartyl-tRNA(Asn)/glutamyl-tRNA(Gln) amidotransferase subunit A
MAFSDDVFFAPLTELNAQLRAKKFSCVELTQAFADRLEKLGPRYNALALSLRADGVKKAKQVDDDIKRDRLRGPLQGVPFGVKDLLAVARYPTTWGAKPFEKQVFEEDAAVVKKLNKAGAVLIGKLAMVELAGGGGYRYPAASLHGPGLNPWDTGRWSGGSSSGSGSAVSAALVPFALGSETSGSILTPAAFCGVTGLRPTYGLVSRAGAMALSWTMDKIGPLGRTAEDCGHVLQVIAGGDAQDPGSAGKSFYYAPQLQKPVAQMRIGYAPGDFSDWADPAARPAFNAAWDEFRKMGVQFHEIKLPDFPFGAVTGTIISAEGSTVFEEIITNGEVDTLADQRQAQGLKAGREILAVDYLKAMRIRRMIQDAFRDLFTQVDAILSPARYNIASKITDPLDRGQNSGRPRPTVPGLGGLIGAGNLAGLPALCVPCGFADQMPLALQLVSRPFQENLILRLGDEFQKRTDWHRRRPPVPA